jgi:ABC-type sugar transport system ATPase subunit
VPDIDPSHDEAEGLSGSSDAGSLVEISSVSKTYGVVKALDQVSLDVERAEVLGICGHNGAGKSTLLKLLAGLERPDLGTLRVNGHPVEFRRPEDAQRQGIALVDQELSLVPVLTVAENLVLGNLGEPMIVRRKGLHRRAEGMLARVGLTHVRPGTLTSELTLGERQLVEIARLLGRNADLLILDEPTATLSQVEIVRVFSAVRAAVQSGKSVIYVSHRLDEVLALCDRVTVMRDGRVVETAPARDLEKPQLVELMVGAQGHELPAPTRSVSNDRAVQISGFRIPDRVEEVELEVGSGTIVGLAGQIGSGAGALLRGLAGSERGATGHLSVRGRTVGFAAPHQPFAAGVQYISNDRKVDGLFLSQSVEANLNATRLGRLASWGWLSARSRRRSATELSRLLEIPPRRIRAPVRTLSGGNQQKVLLGRCLENESLALLLLDDPTRGVDVRGRAEIHRLIRQAAASRVSVIFASTELDEIMELADTVVTMFGGRVVSIVPRSKTSPERILSEMTHKSTPHEP